MGRNGQRESAGAILIYKKLYVLRSSILSCDMDFSCFAVWVEFLLWRPASSGEYDKAWWGPLCMSRMKPYIIMSCLSLSKALIAAERRW